MWDNNRASKSAKIFADIIPILKHYFGGEILSTEDHDSQFAKLLDFKCAIDAIVDTDKVVFGIAHRVSYKNYATFTIRLHNIGGEMTEIDKLSKPGIKPRYHVQTICINGKPKIVAIAKTADLVYAINHNIHTTKTAFSGDKFAILDWDKLMDNGITVDIIKL